MGRDMMDGTVHDGQCEKLRVWEAVSRRLNIQQDEREILEASGCLCFCRERSVTEDWRATYIDYDQQVRGATSFLMKFRKHRREQRDQPFLERGPDGRRDLVVSQSARKSGKTVREERVREEVEEKKSDEEGRVIEVDFRNRKKL